MEAKINSDGNRFQATFRFNTVFELLVIGKNRHWIFQRDVIDYLVKAWLVLKKLHVFSMKFFDINVIFNDCTNRCIFQMQE